MRVAFGVDERLNQAQRTVGPITAREYAAARGISPATAWRDLRDLVKRGLAQASGTTNDQRYSLRVDDET